MNLFQLYDEAGRLIAEKHKDQTYGEVFPYTVHLYETASVIKIFFPDTKFYLQICALLHDVIEDTPTTRQEIEAIFGKEIADIVWAVTNEAGANRKERHLKTYPKIKANPDAVLVKLADRISNTSASFGYPIMSMYRKEYAGFREALYVPGTEAEPMWQHLDNLMANDAAHKPQIK